MRPPKTVPPTLSGMATLDLMPCAVQYCFSFPASGGNSSGRDRTKTAFSAAKLPNEPRESVDGKRSQGKRFALRNRIGMGYQHVPWVFAELDQRAPIVSQELHEHLQTAIDLRFDLFGRQVDETRRQVSQQPFEPQAFLHGQLRPLACGNIHHGAHQCRSAIVVKPRSQHLDVGGIPVPAHTACLVATRFLFADQAAAHVLFDSRRGHRGEQRPEATHRSASPARRPRIWATAGLAYLMQPS